MSNRIIILALILKLIFSCQKKEDKLEIYLTKDLIESYEGIPVEMAIKDKSILSKIKKNYGEKIRYDTLTEKIIYSGRFNVKKNDLQKLPFIVDSEIMGIDYEKSEIVFKSSVSDKIYGVIENWDNLAFRGRQFVLCHNNKIILKGYFFNSMSSYWSNTYQIHFYRNDNPKQKSLRFSFNDSINFTENHLMKNSKLVQAFKNR